VDKRFSVALVEMGQMKEDFVPGYIKPCQVQ